MDELKSINHTVQPNSISVYLRQIYFTVQFSIFCYPKTLNTYLTVRNQYFSSKNRFIALNDWSLRRKICSLFVCVTKVRNNRPNIWWFIRLKFGTKSIYWKRLTRRRKKNIFEYGHVLRVLCLVLLFMMRIGTWTYFKLLRNFHHHIITVVCIVQ